jgi:hypothetical protein
MRRAIRHCAASGAAIALVLAGAPPAGAVLGIGISTPTVSMTLSPGSTATGSGTVAVTPGIGTWRLSISDSSGHAGHLAPGAVGCAGAQSLTTNALSATATGLAADNISNGPVSVSASPQQIAQGTLLEAALTVNFSLVLPNTERMPTGCVFSTTLTYTLQ